MPIRIKTLIKKKSQFFNLIFVNSNRTLLENSTISKYPKLLSVANSCLLKPTLNINRLKKRIVEIVKMKREKEFMILLALR
jgi:hypothetical protein